MEHDGLWKTVFGNTNLVKFVLVPFMSSQDLSVVASLNRAYRELVNYSAEILPDRKQRIEVFGALEKHKTRDSIRLHSVSFLCISILLAVPCIMQYCSLWRGVFMAACTVSLALGWWCLARFQKALIDARTSESDPVLRRIARKRYRQTFGKTFLADQDLTWWVQDGVIVPIITFVSACPTLSITLLLLYLHFIHFDVALLRQKTSRYMSALSFIVIVCLFFDVLILVSSISMDVYTQSGILAWVVLIVTVPLTWYALLGGMDDLFEPVINLRGGGSLICLPIIAWIMQMGLFSPYLPNQETITMDQLAANCANTTEWALCANGLSCTNGKYYPEETNASSSSSLSSWPVNQNWPIYLPLAPFNSYKPFQSPTFTHLDISKSWADSARLFVFHKAEACILNHVFHPSRQNDDGDDWIVRELYLLEFWTQGDNVTSVTNHNETLIAAHLSYMKTCPPVNASLSFVTKSECSPQTITSAQMRVSWFIAWTPTYLLLLIYVLRIFSSIEWSKPVSRLPVESFPSPPPLAYVADFSHINCSRIIQVPSGV